MGDAVRWLWGTENRMGPSPAGLSGAVPILGQLFPAYELAMLVAGPAVALGLWALLRHTRWGILIRAATHDREMVGALGVDQARLFTGVFVLGSWLAGLAGGLQAPRQAISLGMDSAVIAESFVVVVVGGMGNVFGALLAAVLIGLLQAFGILWLPRELQLPLVFLLMAGVLVLRPWGLLGRAEAPPLFAGGPPPRPALPRWLPLGLLGLLLLLPPMLPPFGIWLLTQALALALVAGSLQLLIGTAGMVTFGHAAYFGLGAYGAAMALTLLGAGLPVALLAGVALAAILAGLFGAFCVRLSSIYFAMLTLAFAQIVHAVVHQWYDVTGGDNGIVGVWPPATLATPLRYYYVCLGVAALGLWLLHRVTGSPFGLLLRAARDHAGRCEAIGVNVQAHRLLAFVVAGACAGLGGGLFVFLQGSAFPAYLGIPVSVQGLLMVLLGGIQSLAGAVLGAGLYAALDAAVAGYTDYWQILLGVILMGLVLAFPDGLLPSVLRRRAKEPPRD
jgi:branched-chain amino acid transport system permease protein